MIKKLTNIFILLLVFTGANAQIRLYSNDFLNIGTNANAAAKGNAIIAQTRGANAVFWNPANMVADSFNTDIAVSHHSLYQNLAQEDYFSAAFKQKNKAYGIALLRLGVDDIQNTLNLVDTAGQIDYNRITYFSTADYALFLSFADKLDTKNPLNYGLSAKIIYRHIGNFASAYGFGLDAAVSMPVGKWNMAATLKNIAGTYTFWAIHKNAFEASILDSLIPTDFKSLEIASQELSLGVQRAFRLNDFLQLSTEIDAKIPFVGKRNAILTSSFASLYPAVGAELVYKTLAFLRLGINQFQKFEAFDSKKFIQSKLSLGIGLHIKQITLDYAFVGFANSDNLQASHVLSLSYRR